MTIMPEQQKLEREEEEFKSGKLFVDLDWDDLGFTSPPKEWEGRTGKFKYFKHRPCGQILKFFAEFAGPKGVRSLIDSHSKSCQKESAGGGPS